MVRGWPGLKPAHHFNAEKLTLPQSDTSILERLPELNVLCPHIYLWVFSSKCVASGLDADPGIFSDLWEVSGDNFTPRASIKSRRPPGAITCSLQELMPDGDVLIVLLRG